MQDMREEATELLVQSKDCVTDEQGQPQKLLSLLEKYAERPKLSAFIPFGFEQKEGDPNLLVPVPALVQLLDEALDQLNAGVSLRKACDYINAHVPEEYLPLSLSHTGLCKLRDYYRPEEKPKKKRISLAPMSREERKERIKRLKIANEKKRVTHAQKRIAKHEQDIGILRVNDVKKEVDNSLLLELDYGDAEFQEIEQEVPIIFKPNPGPQTTFFAAEEQEVLYGGSAGSGKSYALIADPMRYFDNSNFRGLILRRTNDELRELIWKSQELYVQIWKDAVWREKDKEWRFPSGARLWMTYLEREEDVLRYQGQAFTYIGIDELTQYPTPHAWDYMRSRLRDSSGTLPLFMRATSNPGGPGHGWVKRMFIDPAPWGKSFWATDIETGQPLTNPNTNLPLFKRKFIPAKLADNPYLSKDGRYESSLLSLRSDLQRQLLYGDWDVADGAAFSEFRQSSHVIEPYDIPKAWIKFRSCDFGYSTRQASAVHWYAIHPATGQLIVYRELYVNQHTGRELARKVLSLERNESISYGVLDSSCWAVRGQTGPSIAEEMISEGCKWRPSDRSNGSRVAGKNRLHELLRVDPFSKLSGIVFFNTCRQIISDLPVIPSDKDSDDIDTKYASDHAYDSIRYGIMSRPKTSDTGMSLYSRSTSSWQPADPRFGY